MNMNRRTIRYQLDNTTNRFSAENSPDLIDHLLGSQISALRCLNEIDSQAMADYLRISLQQLGQIEAGQELISAKMLWEIGRLFNLPVNFFFNQIEKYENLEALQADILRIEESETLYVQEISRIKVPYDPRYEVPCKNGFEGW